MSTEPLTGRGLLDAVDHWERLSRRGLVVVLNYGTGTFGQGWYVGLRRPTDVVRSEDQFLHGRNIAHCLEIAEREARKRGWIKD